jgi:tyrosine-protein kinase Etk/Wzc
MQNDSVEASELWHRIKASWKSILLGGIAGFVLSAVYALTLHNQFTATSSFVVPRAQSSSLSLLSEQVQTLATGYSGYHSTGDNYISILKSRRFQDTMINRFHLLQVYKVQRMSAAEGILAGQSKFDSADNLLRVNVTNEDPKLAASLANAYADALRQTNGELALTEVQQRRAFFEQQMLAEKNELDIADAQLKKTQEHSGLVAPAAQTSIQLQGEGELRSSIQTREAQLAGLLKGSTEQNPEVIRLRGELASLRGELAGMQHGGSSSANGLSNAEVPQAALDYLHAQRDVAYHEALFGVLSKQYEAARLDEEHDAPVIQVLDTATVPDSRSGPRRTLIALCGLLLGAFGVMIWVVWRSFTPPKIILKA